MLEGLDGSGVVGLTLTPESLRHPFGLTGPVLGPADYVGERVRSPRSDTVARLFDSLGASATDDDPTVSEQVAMESAYETLSNEINAPFATGNVTFFAKVNTLVINDDVLADLDPVQLDVLRAAAAELRTWALDSQPGDLAAAAEWCAAGRSIVHATAADLSALQQAAAPVYTWLEQDVATRRSIEQIRTIKAELQHPPPAPPTCTGDLHVEVADGLSPTDPSILDGVYRFEITEDDIRAAGVDDPALLAEASVFTWTFDDGVWCWERRAEPPVANPEECGTYRVDGDEVTVFFPAGPPAISRWEFDDDQALRWVALVDDGGDPLVALAGLRPWVRLGDAG
jgi:hypothetical protein